MHIAALWRYPVKSMQGEALVASPVGAAGLLGDRAYAVVEAATGRVASAKHPRKWGSLFACRAVFTEPPHPGRALPPVRITLPDGTRVRSDQSGVHAALSALLGRAVRLVAAPGPGGAENPPGSPVLRETDRTPLDPPLETSPDRAGHVLIRDEPIALAAPAGTWFDVAPLHLLTTATLAALRARAPASDFDVRRFRPNVLVGVEPSGPAEAPEFPENTWIGHTVVGARPGARAAQPAHPVILAVVDPTPRCVVTTLAAEGLRADADVLRTVARANTVRSQTLAPGVPFAGVAGVYATVLAGGELARGDFLTTAIRG